MDPLVIGTSLELMRQPRVQRDELNRNGFEEAQLHELVVVVPCSGLVRDIVRSYEEVIEYSLHDNEKLNLLFYSCY